MKRNEKTRYIIVISFLILLLVGFFYSNILSRQKSNQETPSTVEDTNTSIAADDPSSAALDAPTTSPTADNANDTVTANRDTLTSSDSAIDGSDLNLTIKTSEISIGLAKEYQFLFFSDSHVEVPSEEEPSDEIKDYVASRNMSTLPDLSSGDILERFMEYANNQNVDAVLMGGDIIDSPATANIDFFRQSVNELHMPYLYVLGNHDWTFPWEYFTDYALQNYVPLLNEFTHDDTNVQVLEFDDLLIVGVDDSTNQISEATLAEVKNVLQTTKPVILVLHVPLAADQNLITNTVAKWNSSILIGNGGVPPTATTSSFISLITDPSSPIVAVLGAHIHFASNESVNNNIIQITSDPAYAGCGILLTVK